MLLDNEHTIHNLPFSNLQNSVPIIFQFISTLNTFLIFFHELYINTFGNIFPSLKAKIDETIFLENSFSKYHFLAAFFSVAFSIYSFQHGRCWKLNICVSPIFQTKRKNRKYSIASMLLKLSILQRARKSNFKFYFLPCRLSQFFQFLITDIITTRAIERKSFGPHCNKLIRAKTSRRLRFFEVPGIFLFTSEYTWWKFFSY